MSEVDWAKLIKSWFPELASRRLNQLTWPDIEEHRARAGLVGPGRTGAAQPHRVAGECIVLASQSK
ncbi:hypothetical protein OG749_01595 [Streptomyces nojiriensis]|uniref:hypothetical protein n=1 Tax=Streptomyces nojiriensis TaxID=66374 RepID=UPI002E17609F